MRALHITTCSVCCSGQTCRATIHVHELKWVTELAWKAVIHNNLAASRECSTVGKNRIKASRMLDSFLRICPSSVEQSSEQVHRSTRGLMRGSAIVTPRACHASRCRLRVFLVQWCQVYFFVQSLRTGVALTHPTCSCVTDQQLGAHPGLPTLP